MSPGFTLVIYRAYPIWRAGLLTCPAASPLHRLPPATEQPVALGLAQLGLVASRLAPHLPHLVGGPLTRRDPGQVGGAERRGLRNRRDDHGHTQYVRLELHQPGVGDGAAVG